jgi:hypothetical protein
MGETRAYPGWFAAVFVVLFVAHQVADHWVQTEHQAATKGAVGWAGRWSCLKHVGTYTATCAAGLGLLGWAAGPGLYGAPSLLGGLGVSAVTHYIADRRAPLGVIAGWAGHAGFWALGRPRAGQDDNPCLGTGAYALDQSWHYLWLAVSAGIIAAG